MVKRAERLVEGLGRGSNDDAVRIERAYLLLYARFPTAREAALAHDFLQAGRDRHDRWQQYAQILVASNELLYLD